MYITPQLRGDEKIKYVRKSRADDPLLSVEEVLAKHEQMLDEWVERNQPEGGPVPEANTFREVGSGETISSRPRMQALLRAVESDKIKALMVVEPSRLTRGDLEDIGRIVKILKYTKTLVITLNYTYDLNDDRDRDLFERELMRGNEFLQYTKRIQLNGRIHSVKSGNYIGQTAPYGYKKVMHKDGKRKSFTLEPVPQEAEVVRRIFELYSQTCGAVKVSDILNEEHIPAPKGGLWSDYSVLTILSNVHYLGKVRWNARKTVTTVVNGEIVRSRPRADECLIFDGKHPAIIDQDLWDKVQAVRGTHPRNPKAHNLTNPLAGLLWCECGRAMTGRTYTCRGKEACLPRFLCNQQRRCGNASALRSEVLGEVERVLAEAIDEFEVRIKGDTDQLVAAHNDKVARMEKRLEDLRNQETKQWAERIKGKMPDHVFEALNRELVDDISSLEKSLAAERANMPERVYLENKIVTFKAALDALRDHDAPVRDVNRLLKACINRITYSRQRVGSRGHPKRGEETPIRMHFDLKV